MANNLNYFTHAISGSTLSLSYMMIKKILGEGLNSPSEKAAPKFFILLHIICSTYQYMPQHVCTTSENTNLYFTLSL